MLKEIIDFIPKTSKLRIVKEEEFVIVNPEIKDEEGNIIQEAQGYMEPAIYEEFETTIIPDGWEKFNEEGISPKGMRKVHKFIEVEEIKEEEV